MSSNNYEHQLYNIILDVYCHFYFKIYYSHICQIADNLKREFCFAEPCTIDEDHMDRNNIQMKWKFEGKILHGDLIDFVCKQGYDLSPTTPLSELSVQCNRGNVRYPVCVQRGKE